MDAARQRMMQYDKDGDGQLSDEERRAAFQEFGNWRRDAPGTRDESAQRRRPTPNP